MENPLQLLIWQTLRLRKGEVGRQMVQYLQSFARRTAHLPQSVTLTTV